MVNLDEIILKTAQRETLELDEREGGEIPDVDLKGKYLSRSLSILSERRSPYYADKFNCESYQSATES